MPKQCPSFWKHNGQIKVRGMNHTSPLTTNTENNGHPDPDLPTKNFLMNDLINWSIPFDELNGVH